MKVLVGLGNPGKEYELTRHNLGFVVVDRVVAEQKLSWQEKPKLRASIAKDSHFVAIKPLSFMNNAGQPVRAVIDYFFDQPDLSQMWVVFDDLDLELGKYKIQFGKGPHGHNGLLSLYEHLGTDQFWHVRVGVDGRAGERVIPPDRYVLNQFDVSEKNILNQVLEQVTQNLVALVDAKI